MGRPRLPINAADERRYLELADALAEEVRGERRRDELRIDRAADAIRDLVGRLKCM